MSFNPQRAEALRTAIIGTSQTLRHYPEGDAKTLLTEHLALLQEAELIYLTDAFVGEGEERDRRAGRVDLQSLHDDPHAELRKTWAPGQRWQVYDYCKGDWVNVHPSLEPLWSLGVQYRRHPDDVDQPAEPEWVNWAGGEMPVKRGTPIEVKHRSGQIYTTVAGGSYAVRWTCEYISTDIVAYKVVK